MQMNGIIQCLEPVGVREPCIQKHGSDAVQEGVVELFCNAIVLWCIGSHHFVLYSTFLEKLLDMACSVFTPPSEQRTLTSHLVSSLALKTNAFRCFSTLDFSLRGGIEM